MLGQEPCGLETRGRAENSFCKPKLLVDCACTAASLERDFLRVAVLEDLAKIFALTITQALKFVPRHAPPSDAVCAAEATSLTS